MNCVVVCLRCAFVFLPHGFPYSTQGFFCVYVSIWKNIYWKNVFAQRSDNSSVCGCWFQYICHSVYLFDYFDSLEAWLLNGGEWVRVLLCVALSARAAAAEIAATSTPPSSSSSYTTCSNAFWMRFCVASGPHICNAVLSSEQGHRAAATDTRSHVKGCLEPCLEYDFLHSMPYSNAKYIHIPTCETDMQLPLSNVGGRGRKGGFWMSMKRWRLKCAPKKKCRAVAVPNAVPIFLSRAKPASRSSERHTQTPADMCSRCTHVQ